VVTKGVVNNQAAVVSSGQVYIQDEASQLVAQLLDPEPGLSMLDLCAAPGGKSARLAVRMKNSGIIVAGDLHLHRLTKLQRACQRLGLQIVSPVALDGTKPLPFLQRFDRVLVDAPCSGTGTLRRNPEIKWRLKPEDINALTETQSQLLLSASGMVAADGRLVYSTCSLEREENEMVVERFLAGNSNFELIRPSVDPVLLQPDGTIRTFPHRDEMDGFFIAVFQGKKRKVDGSGDRRFALEANDREFDDLSVLI
jgi:16S rRNA (cytosine967-C5)-methyltransferase